MPATNSATSGLCGLSASASSSAWRRVEPVVAIARSNQRSQFFGSLRIALVKSRFAAASLPSPTSAWPSRLHPSADHGSQRITFRASDAARPQFRAAIASPALEAGTFPTRPTSETPMTTIDTAIPRTVPGLLIGTTAPRARADTSRATPQSSPVSVTAETGLSVVVPRMLIDTDRYVSW